MIFEKVLFGLTCLAAIILFVNRFVFKNRYNKKNPQPEPLPVDYARSFFPVLLAVFLLRAFIVEPFRIPSGSMLPTLEIGDFLLVNKFEYGLRLPITYQKVLPLKNPKRGDIIVFRFPRDKRINYIKRVVGLPGDVVEYRNKRLFVNQQEVAVIPEQEYQFVDARRSTHKVGQYQASLDNGAQYSVLLNPLRPPSRPRRWVVPEGQYFAMGDNRDHSADSREWGFVPDENIVGKAFFIWFHWDTVTDRGVDWSRIGEDI